MGLQGVLKTYAENEKRFKLFADKHGTTGIICGIVDKPLFGGVYGLVISKSGITSRDLMEKSITSSWNDIRQHPAQTGNKKDTLFAGQQNHIVPGHESANIPAIISLINEIADGEVIL